MKKKEFIIRLSIFFIGIFILSFGIVMIIKANLGVSAWDVFHIGLNKTFGLTVGTWSQIVGIVIIFITLLVKRDIIAVGTILNMIFIGFFIDFFIYVMPEINNLVYQYIFLLTGIIIMGVGAGLYITASLGPGPRDSLMMALTIKYGWSVTKVKTIMEVVVLIIGWFLGGPVFVGTLIAAILIGPIIHHSLNLWQKVLAPLFLYIRKDPSDNNFNQIEKEEVL